MAVARSRVAGLGIVLAALSGGAACSGDEPSNGRNGSEGTAGTSESGGEAGISGGSGAGAGGFANAAGMRATTVQGGANAVDPGATECVGETQVAEPVLVDMYIMLDRSDSMRLATGTGATKWDAMRSALTTFLSDPESAGLGVGLQYFPLGAPGIPESCEVDAECGTTGGACANRVCRPPPFAMTFMPIFCLSDLDCPINSPGCEPMGVCEMDDTLACFNLGPGGCQDQGACIPLIGQCTAFASCEVDDYAAPAVAIAALPDNAGPLTASLMGQDPIGLTPTPPALAGALEHSAAYAAANPTHRVIAVLATDGLPTDCLPPNTMDVDQAVDATADIAARGFASTPSIETYVIGVFSPDEPDPQGRLDRLASAGGTDTAFIVDASQDVSQQLLDALATIRAGTLDCEFQLPTPPDGQRLDYYRVNVEVTADGTLHQLLYVRNADGCAQADLGWYYDADPDQGGTPMQIRVCESTCNTFRDLPGASVDIRLGCATRGPE